MFSKKSNASTAESEEIVETSLSSTDQVISKPSRPALVATGLINNSVLADLAPVIKTVNKNDKKQNTTIESKSRLVIFDSNSVVSVSGLQDTSNDDANSIANYIVEDGDSPASIADSFGITTDTLLWANNLKSGDYIKPGQVLKIMPISGVMHKVVTKDSVNTIAKKYNAKVDDIIVYNNLPADGQLKTGDTLIVPNGVMPVPPKPKAKPVPAVPQDNHDENVWVNPAIAHGDHTPAQSHKFPWGQCTYYVAKKRYVPWGGDAKRWLSNAPAYGFKTGKTPIAGAIVQTTENARYGHVAIVESVNGDGTITISEMNYKGLGITSRRVLPINSRVIKGYIY